MQDRLPSGSLVRMVIVHRSLWRWSSNSKSIGDDLPSSWWRPVSRFAGNSHLPTARAMFGQVRLFTVVRLWQLHSAMRRRPAEAFSIGPSPSRFAAEGGDPNQTGHRFAGQWHQCDHECQRNSADSTVQIGGGCDALVRGSGRSANVQLASLSSQLPCQPVR